MNYVHECHVENAAQFWEWIKNRGGVAVWQSQNLSNPGASWSTPARALDGTTFGKPTWQAGDTPALVVTDPDLVKVYDARVVKKVHVAVEARGASIKLTTAASRKLNAAVTKAGPGAYYRFVYGEHENAVIMLPCGEMSLGAWALEKGL